MSGASENARGAMEQSDLLGASQSEDGRYRLLIEAVTDYPHRQVLLWTTTDGYAPHVLDEIVAGLAAGKIVQPTGCIYSGQED